MNLTGDGMYDVAVVGLGPAGRALASRGAAAGLRVLAIDPAPDVRWRRTLCLWADELPAWLDADVLAHTVRNPALYAPERAVIDRTYAVLDNDRLWDALPLGDGATVERQALSDSEVAGLTSRAHRVVDCRGALGPGDHGPLQTAYGIVLGAGSASPALRGDPAVFMDWRTDHDDDEVGPSFLYAIPLGHDRVLLEETCLAGRDAPGTRPLRERLRSRLIRRGVSAAAVDDPLAVEEVRIPLLPPGREYADPRVTAFGTAGGHGHAATGYSGAARGGAVPGAVNALVTGYPLPRPRARTTTALHHAGLRALLGAEDATLHGLFDAFGRIDERRQRWFLGGTGPSYQVASSMWQMWTRMPARERAGMIAAVARGTRR